jgi:hypothetical protein
MSDLVSLGNLKSLLNITDNEDDTMLGLLNSSVTSLIETYCNRNFTDGTYTEYQDGCELPDIYVNEWPITTVTSIYDDPLRVFDSVTLLDSTTYTFYSNEGRISLLSDSYVFSVGKMNIKIDYRAGYTTIPADLQLIASEVVGKKYKNIKDKRWGYLNVSSAGEGFTIMVNDFLPDHRLILDTKYRSRGTQ